MTNLTTNGVSINVSVEYRTKSDYENRSDFLFIYHIAIKNSNAFPVQIKRRKWRIFDSNGAIRLVEGEGVVGFQPVIEPNQTFEYSSFCNLFTELGNMSGSYILENLLDYSPFEVEIPVFELATPTIRN
ncbi:MAG: Co2+/Mg2+ efflux protein ApaG [Bacteroidetes bacterium]|jgi:ApaG protein|nr:Co2+/Mg2+ efflux protein ApaG [Bacteroidota bacterium]